MNKDLEEIVKTYATKTHEELSDNLCAKSKETVIVVLVDLLTIYFNDKNSSTLREYILVVLSGFTPNEKKIGYNGYKQEATDGTKSEVCEAKPKNINTSDENPQKLNGAGNFTDYTWGRFERDKKSNPLMIVGGFIDGRLIYMFRFLFNSKPFTDALEEKLTNKFSGCADIDGEYLRSARFSLRDYENISGLELEVFVSKEELKERKEHITGPLYSLLEKHHEENR